MTNVTMKAVDTLHLSSVQADSLRPGEEFTVPSSYADELEKRGLASRVGDAPAAEPAAEEAAVETKDEPPVETKAPITTKARAKRV